MGAALGALATALNSPLQGWAISCPSSRLSAAWQRCADRGASHGMTRQKGRCGSEQRIMETALSQLAAPRR